MTKAAAVYGQGLYDLAKEENLAEVIFEEYREVSRIIYSEPDYIRLLSEPSISKETKVNLIDEAFAGRIQKYLLNFIKILCEKNAASELKGCFEAYKELYYKDNNIAEAVVTSAVKLSDEQRSALKAKLEAMSSKQIILKEKVDASFIAGICVDLLGKQYDGTAIGRINAIKKRVTDIIV